MVYCICMVFAALSEYGVVLLVKFRNPPAIKKSSRKKGIQKALENDGCGDNIVNVNTMGNSHGASKVFFKRHAEKDYDASPHATETSLDTTVGLCKKIDTISLFLFPAAFFCFLVIYYILYLNVF